MSKRKHTSLDVDAVLAGRVKPTAAELLEAIHRENPTGRALAAQEIELRYTRKARLQSLLVRMFASDLEVTRDPWQPGAIALRHRGHARDACHAVLDALDEDARAWVQRELDLAADAGDRVATSSAPMKARGARRPTSKEDDGSTPEDLVLRAEASIADYDYDAARATLEAAMEISDGAVGPAAALIALLVDTLGDDAAALAVERSLGRAALADPRVRAPLALAAARSGEHERALDLSRGLGDSSAARVLVAIASDALIRGDDARAIAHLEDARRRDPTCETIAGVAAAIAKWRAAAREPAEAELAAAVAAGADTDVERKATSLLARWPESPAARRALHELGQRRRRAEAARLLAEAEEATLQGDVALSLSRLRQALANASATERESLERRIAALEDAERERHDSKRVDETVSSLAAHDPKAGLAAYASLDVRLRAKVRARSTAAELEWIDLMSVGRGTARAWVDAAMAITRARAALPNDPEAAIALLTPHDPLLERVADARRIVRDAEQALFVRRLEAARVAVAKARKQLGVGAASEAIATLGGVSLRDLPDDERAEAARTEAAAMRLIDRRQREIEAAVLRDAGKWFEARALAQALAEDADDAAERARWQGEAVSLQSEIRRSFRVELDDEPRAPDDLGRLRQYVGVSDASWWLTPDGGRAVIARTFDRWLIVAILDLESMQVCPTITLRVPEALRGVDAMVCGDTLWLVGERGAVVELSMVSWDVMTFRPSSDFVAATDIVEDVAIVATDNPSSPRYLWVSCRTHGAAKTRPLRVIDLAQRRTVRELPDLWRATPIAGGDELRVLAMKDSSATLYSPRGVPLPDGRLDGPLDVHTLATHPSGEGFVALLSAASSDPLDPPDGSLKLATLSRTGHVDALVELDADPERVSSIVAARSNGCVYTITTDGDAALLSAFATGEDRRLSALYAVAAGRETKFVQDGAGRHVVALTVHDFGVDAIALGATPPTFPCDLRARASTSPAPSVLLRATDLRASETQRCSRSSDRGRSSRTPRSCDALDISSNRRRRRRRSSSRWCSRCARTIRASRGTRRPLSWCVASRLAFRSTPKCACWRHARFYFRNGGPTSARWSRTSIRPCSMRRVPNTSTTCARSRPTTRDGSTISQAAIDAAGALDGACDLDDLRVLAERPPIDDGNAGDDGLLGELVAAIGRADACFAASDLDGARRALDVPLIWSTRERQSLARLTDVYLAMEPVTPRDRIRKLATLGTLLDELDESRTTFRNELRVRGAWDGPRIDEVAARARAWLDARGESLASFGASPLTSPPAQPTPQRERT